MYYLKSKCGLACRSLYVIRRSCYQKSGCAGPVTQVLCLAVRDKLSDLMLLCKLELSRLSVDAVAMHSLPHNLSLVWSSVSLHIVAMPWFHCLAIGTSCIASML